ncbi:MAG: glycosyltransferase family 2 protein [Firmicutes bacterium]|nr:glycosyltransferase family 2 protein [Bacillota bacterium]
MSKLVSYIIPAYNERAYIGNVVRELSKVSLPAGVQYEIVVVDDGSSDGTADYLEAVTDVINLRVHRLPQNRGKGFALREGFRVARGDVVIVCDADSEYSPDDIPKIIQPILEGRAEIVYGSRFLGSISGMKFANRLANKILTATANILFRAKITDEATAYKAFKKEVLDSVNLVCTGFEFCPEVTAKMLKRGYKINEVPIKYTARTVKEGKKIRWQDGFIAIWTLIKYRLID